MANKEEKQINPWDLLLADVKMYQADCLLSVGFDTQCQQCTKNEFASIINMINKYAKQAGSGAPERKTGKWIFDGCKDICSACGASRENQLWDEYCGRCGVKMEVDDGNIN